MILNIVRVKFFYNDVYKTTNAIQRQTDRHYTQEDRLGDPFGC